MALETVAARDDRWAPPGGGTWPGGSRRPSAGEPAGRRGIDSGRKRGERRGRPPLRGSSPAAATPASSRWAPRRCAVPAGTMVSFDPFGPDHVARGVSCPRWDLMARFGGRSIGRHPHRRRQLDRREPQSIGGTLGYLVVRPEPMTWVAACYTDARGADGAAAVHGAHRVHHRDTVLLDPPGSDREGGLLAHAPWAPSTAPWRSRRGRRGSP